MEIAIIIVSIIIVVGLFEELTNRFRSINWTKLLGVLIVGVILLALIFSFTAEGVLVIVGAYAILVILALLFGVFSNKTVNKSHEQGIEKGRHEVAKNLLDILDDETIANKTKLSIDEVKILRLKK
ncbi:hypothetical protein G3485_16215 [Shewanella baltica]|uniref:hypothetical protein n=1 Tax=Shewanella TaxID=22 RepID=UPI00217F216B|nr:hypothetical protein [Shewanella baltica]MCS6128667.1 hypothetical protein [Shewanella baltica]MCS6140598.1 hypothetical protein [Shewanella baltica]MCS6146881.1 hypothetical protein [Shewanella baltica]MCS6171411.1 hypothetical protein [Shewanella baltica]MCS6188635.1 hypothetical protein [Shewanella baltica]